MRNATLDSLAMVATLGRLADLAESYIRAETYAPEVAEQLVRELEGLGMRLQGRKAVTAP